MGLPRHSRALTNGLTQLSLLKGSAGGLLGRELEWGYLATASPAHMNGLTQLSLL